MSDNATKALRSLERTIIKQIIPLVVFLSSAVVVLLVFLAFGWLPGVPDPAQRSLAIYYQPGADKAEFSVYVHPPMSTIQVGGESQRLAFELTNKSGSEVLVEPPSVSPSSCFTLSPVPSVDKVAPHSSVAAFFDLTASHCKGQYPLIFRYSWKVRDAGNPAAVQENAQSISTGPIRVTSRVSSTLERLFRLSGKIISLFLIPAFLAGISLFFQHFQERKAELQKEQEQKLEVWKTILPGIIQAIRDHYIPILRVIAIMKDETSKPASTANGDDILASALLMRRKITHLTDTSGGFYFRNNRGEELCASLTNLFMARCYDLSGDKESFHRAAESLAPDCTLTQAKATLRIAAPLPGKFSTMCTHFKSGLLDATVLNQMEHHLEMIAQVLNYEANGPFYPWWYDEPPSLDKTKLVVSGLGLTNELTSELDAELSSYLRSIDNADKS